MRIISCGRPFLTLRGTIAIRRAQPSHPIQNGAPNPRLGELTRQGTTLQPSTDEAFVPRDRRLDETSSSILRLLFPAPAADGSDPTNVRVSLARPKPAQLGVTSGRDHNSSRLLLPVRGNCVIHASNIIRTVRGERRYVVIYRVEQC